MVEQEMDFGTRRSMLLRTVIPEAAAWFQAGLACDDVLAVYPASTLRVQQRLLAQLADSGIRRRFPADMELVDWISKAWQRQQLSRRKMRALVDQYGQAELSWHTISAAIHEKGLFGGDAYENLQVLLWFFAAALLHPTVGGERLAGGDTAAALFDRAYVFWEQLLDQAYPQSMVPFV